MSAPPTAEGPSPRVLRIWDAPTRIVHALILALVALAWWTETHDEMPQHLLAGYALAGVLAFRLIWGFVGGSTARFAGFVRRPQAVWRYAKQLMRPGPRRFVIGHNPMGGWSVIALLGMLLAVVGTGLFASDTDGVASGPLATRVSYDFSAAAAHWHSLLFDALLALIGLHFVAVVFYLLVRRENLMGPMVNGRRRLASSEPGLKPAGRLALGLAVAAGGLVAVLLARL